MSKSPVSAPRYPVRAAKAPTTASAQVIMSTTEPVVTISMPKPGDQATDFSLPNQDGKIVSLRDFRGKYLCIYFYPKDNTPGCTAEGCLFRDYNEELKALNCEVIGISADSPESHKKFHLRKQFNFELLSDTEHQVLESYGAWQQKSIFGKKFWGIQRSTFLIDPDGKIAAVWPKADPYRNPQQVLDFLTK